MRWLAISAALLSDLTAILAIAIWAPEDDALSGLILGVGILVVIPLELIAAVSGYFAWRARRLHTAGVIGVGAASLAALAALALAVLAHQSRLDDDPFAPSRTNAPRPPQRQSEVQDQWVQSPLVAFVDPDRIVDAQVRVREHATNRAGSGLGRAVGDRVGR